MKKRQKSLVVFILVSMLSACNLPARPTSSPGIDQAVAGTLVAMTLEALRTKIPAGNTPDSTPTLLNQQIANSPMPSATPSLAVTPTPTGTITPTYQVPMLTFNVNSNCREGPGTNFKVVIVLKTGQQVQALGTQGNYWIVKSPKDSTACWVANELASPSGSYWTLPTMTAPPAPTANPPTAPGWSKYNYNCVYAAGGSTLTMNLVWSDRSNNETGFKIYRDGQEVANLAADTTSYTDVTFVASGLSLGYYVEAYSEAGKASSSTITASCQ